MTPTKPKTLIQWEEQMPHVCHNCMHYVQALGGICEKANGAEPPERFKETDGACEMWEDFPF